MSKRSKSAKFYIALVIFSLVGQVAWVVENMYLNVFIYKMFQASPESISAMVAASAVAATVTTLLVGALSDKVGKRKLFICGGYILWGISIWSFALIRLDVINAVFPAVASAASLGVTLVIVMDCVMTFFGSSANDAAFNAWLTDSTDDTNRGHDALGGYFGGIRRFHGCQSGLCRQLDTDFRRHRQCGAGAWHCGLFHR